MAASKLNMRNTTLCYLEQNGAYLMLHRVKKENDLNHDKWVGIGGKFEEGEHAGFLALLRNRHLCIRRMGNGIHASFSFGVLSRRIAPGL